MRLGIHLPHIGRKARPEAKPIVRRLRAARPDPGFTLSVRSGWNGTDEGALAAHLAGYAEAGVDHVLVEPQERALDAWLHVVERVAHIGESVR